MASDRQHVSLKVPGALLELIDKRAAERGVTRSTVILDHLAAGFHVSPAKRATPIAEHFKVQVGPRRPPPGSRLKTKVKTAAQRETPAA